MSFAPVGRATGQLNKARDGLVPVLPTARLAIGVAPASLTSSAWIGALVATRAVVTRTCFPRVSCLSHTGSISNWTVAVPAWKPRRCNLTSA